MPTRPKVLDVSLQNGDLLTITYDQHVVADLAVNVEAFKIKAADGTPMKGDSVEDISDETLQLALVEADEADIVPDNGEVSQIDASGVKGQTGGLASYPFVARPGTARILSVFYNDVEVEAEIRWSEPATVVDETMFHFKTAGGVGKVGRSVATGNTTDTWIMNLDPQTNAVPIGTWASAAHMAESNDAYPSAEGAGPLGEF